MDETHQMRRAAVSLTLALKLADHWGEDWGSLSGEEQRVYIRAAAVAFDTIYAGLPRKTREAHQ